MARSLSIADARAAFDGPGGQLLLVDAFEHLLATRHLHVVPEARAISTLCSGALHDHASCAELLARGVLTECGCPAHAADGGEV